MASEPRDEGWREEDDQDDIPLQHRRPFGAGIKRQAVAFVPASKESCDTPDTVSQPKPSKSLSELYLSMVLPSDAGKPTGMEPVSSSVSSMCEVCKLPVDRDSEATKHEASIAHQVCLPHSHPPSSLDRSRMGLNVLKAQGWDPDGRDGLGAQRQGIQYTLKVQAKDDNLGVGARIPKEFTSKKKERVQKLDARKCRKMAAEDKRRSEKLRQQFYGSTDLDKYLGKSEDGI